MEQPDTPNKHITNIEDYDKYLLHSRGEIIQKLRQLAKDKNLLTAHIGNETALTAVIDVLSDNDLLVLDYAPNDKLNEKLINAKRVIVHTKHHGITAQFTASNIKRARLKGNTVLACPLPESLLWVQRRDAYRVRIPISARVTFEFTTSGDQYTECDILDISATGFAFKFDPPRDNLQEGDILHACKVHLADFGTGTIDVEVRNIIDTGNITRIGCTFINISTDMSSMIQRYIHMIDSLQRKTSG
ncbi:MAG: flagellar brake protein [Thioalkalispiraceae bacterium]|jgi:c-di-GMP-binding flagellar brake protein YcgR